MKKLFSVLLAVLLLAALAVPALAAPVIEEPGADGGTPVGQDIGWYIEDDILHLTDTGDTFDFPADEPPFAAYAEEFSVVTIDSGVTSLGSNLFRNCTRLTEVHIPLSVTRIGVDVFSGCTSLKTITYDGTGSMFERVIAEDYDAYDALVQSGVDILMQYSGPVTDPEAAPTPTPAPTPVPGEPIPVEITEELRDDVKTDPTVYSFEEGRDKGRVTSTFRYAYGQAFAMEQYFTLATGPFGGDYSMRVGIPKEDDLVYTFTAQPNAVYLLTYTYGYSTRYAANTSTVTLEGPGGNRKTNVRASGGALRPGYLEVVLIRVDGTAPVPTPAPTPAPQAASVKLSADAGTARAEGFEGLFARVALILDNNGVSGLYVTQATVNPDGSIVIPAFMVPGLRVTAVNIALVPTIGDISKPNPTVAASDFVRF